MIGQWFGFSARAQEGRDMYGIKVSYSWGDEEPVKTYGRFETKEAAWKRICELAGKEMFVQNEEYDERKTCTLYVDAHEKRLDLHYDGDNTVCYYRIVEIADAFDGAAPKTIIEVKDGCVQNVYSNIPELEVQLVDWDNITDVDEQVKNWAEQTMRVATSGSFGHVL